MVMKRTPQQTADLLLELDNPVDLNMMLYHARSAEIPVHMDTPAFRQKIACEAILKFFGEVHLTIAVVTRFESRDICGVCRQVIPGTSFTIYRFYDPDDLQLVVSRNGNLGVISPQFKGTHEYHLNHAQYHAMLEHNRWEIPVEGWGDLAAKVKDPEYLIRILTDPSLQPLQYSSGL